MKHNMNKVTFVLFLGITLVLMGSSIVFAGGEVIPHGGYDATTNSCLFCHDIHDSAGDYVLMRQETVTDTCGTCHDVYKTSGAADRWDKPGQADQYSGNTPVVIPGSASWRAVYEVDLADAATAGGHKLGQGTDDVLFADGATDNGDYIPGGTERLNVLFEVAELGYDPDNPDVVDATTYEAANGLYCASCHTPHGDFGQLLRTDTGAVATVDSDGRGKLLSSRPNHSVDKAVIAGDDWLNEAGPSWCSKCHDQRLDKASGGDLNNHPSTYCLTCHGNYNGTTDEDVLTSYPSDDELTDDFPHTSPGQNILQAEPDELCLRCHVEEEIP